MKTATLRLLAYSLGCAAAVPFVCAPQARAFDRATLAERAAADQAVGFSIYLPTRHRAELDQLEQAQQNPHSALFRHWLTPAAFDARFGTDAATLHAIAAELAARGLQVTQMQSRVLHVTGTVAAVERGFATTLARGVFKDGATRLVASQALTLPPALQQSGAVVAAFSGVTRMHRHAVRAAVPANRSSMVGPYWFDDLKQAYGFPSYAAYNGSGVTIGILMSSGYDPADMRQYFHHEKLAPPGISQVLVNGGAPFSPSASEETHLDIQQSGGAAPGAHVVLYNLPDLTDNSILSGLLQIVQDNTADIVSMSFGSPELAYTALYNNGADQMSTLTVYDDLFAQGNAQGISFVASSGDLGARSMPAVACMTSNAAAGCGHFRPSVETPASDPHVTGVGGTNLRTTRTPGSLDSPYLAESAYADKLTQDIFFNTNASGGYWGSGGGRSILWPRPDFQSGSNWGGTMRMVPDLSMHMGGCPAGALAPCSPYRSSAAVVIGGQVVNVVGTSASAPEFAGLLALKVQKTGARLGNENPDIYAMALAQANGSGPQVFRTTIAGYNDGFYGHSWYNLVVGNGTPDGRLFVGAPDVPVAGTPQSPSNP